MAATELSCETIESECESVRETPAAVILIPSVVPTTILDDTIHKEATPPPPDIVQPQFGRVYNVVYYPRTVDLSK
jgi:hypothetical protein